MCPLTQPNSDPFILLRQTQTHFHTSGTFPVPIHARTRQPAMPFSLLLCATRNHTDFSLAQKFQRIKCIGILSCFPSGLDRAIR